MKTDVSLGEDSYGIIIERGAVNRIKEYTDIKGKVLVVTDSGVPAGYSHCIASQFENSYIYTFEHGEKSKNINTFSDILSFMLDKGFTRKDSVVACGGGVVGDIAGFASACYMRGVDFYNFPTTVLSQVDSSVGGKTAIDFGGIKNSVGAFHQPKCVMIDPDVLKTLDIRQINSGLAEAVKMSLTCDRELFELFENEDIYSHIDEIIYRSVEIKRRIVEQDEKESGLRMILNFGHTIGHGIESTADGLYHGECVALGMIPMCSETVRQRLVPVLEKLGLGTKAFFDEEKVIEAISHDKKSSGDTINTVFVAEAGNCEIRKMSCSELKDRLCMISEAAE